MELPRNLVDEMAQYDPPDAPRRDWVERLPETIALLVQRWGLSDVGRPYQPGGVSSWVAPVTDRTGSRAVLKVGWFHVEVLHEPDALRLWDGNGAARLLESAMFDDTTALLLEECTPGTALSAQPAETQDEVIAGLLPRLWVTPAHGHPFRPLQHMCDLWANEFDEKYAAAPAFDRGLAAAGMELFRSLPASAPRSVLLSTDLHAGNILAAHREPWLVIDPTPYVGDPTYDVLQHMFDSRERLLANPVAFVHRIAGLLDLDAQRLQLWLFARCIQEALDAPELIEVAMTLVP